MKWGLKVWGGGLVDKGKSVRVIVAEYTQKSAVARLKTLGRNVSLYHFRDYWCETGNQAELLVARYPGVWLSEHQGNNTVLKELKA